MMATPSSGPNSSEVPNERTDREGSLGSKESDMRSSQNGDSKPDRLGLEPTIVECKDISVVFPAKAGVGKVRRIPRSLEDDLSQDLAQDLARGDSSRCVLKELNLSVPAGQVVSLLGASGCGKSTLLRVIAGLLPPSGGEVYLHGKPQSGSTVSGRGNGRKLGPSNGAHGISFVFQEPALLPWRTVRENVQLPLELNKGRTKAGRAEAGGEHIVTEWLNTVGLDSSDWNKKPSQLSGGMKMRASIARSMVTSPDILLMDEPFAALDDVLRSKLCDLVLQIVRVKKCTVLFVTHNIAEAVYLSDRIDVMAAGQIAKSIGVNLPKERSSALRSSAEFGAIYADATEALFRSTHGKDSP